jgi:hypothetical protein
MAWADSENYELLQLSVYDEPKTEHGIIYTGKVGCRFISNVLLLNDTLVQSNLVI